ncbi:Maf family protein [Alcaligenes endophyticus]|uniref:dTTP/UTP pyrophosphatase n=1 Tax=Alcaligenes endophyticus TaxID=1929088 RepID=A0ABT8EI49_9BURK|nr:Maf family protein [Alcaligenes endophyticus]MCX5592699.1 Maf family protein [Alcaligenes endophyticus]MDN4120887.1 Maf family nucleotide pyrophosphatase [Alcaligenes endophyticus]
MIRLLAPLYLASASPRRHDILNQMQVPHTVLKVPSPEGEDEPRLDGESPLDYVKRTAADKLSHALHWRDQQAQLDQHAAILSADTTVALNETILGKPLDTEQAVQFLQQLSGQTHQVFTAVCLAYQGRVHHALSISEIDFAALTHEQIHAYCHTGEPMGKAGAYAIQGQAGIFVRQLRGSHSAVVGLPMHETYQLLQQAHLLR